MSKFLAIVFAYMLSISSAIAMERVASDNVVTISAQNALAEIIANDQGLKPNNLRVIIIKGKNALATVQGQNLRVVSLKIDTRFDKFYAILSNGTNNFEISGKFERVRQIPVMARKMLKGETITKADITYTNVNEKIISRGYIADEKLLIGKALTRMVQENKPVMAESLEAAAVVKKDSMVTATYKSGSVILQDNLMALEDGAVGDVIRLKNTNSQRVAKGKVISENNVEITPVNKQLASN
jgi:flagella basal body P-ring formation protein FlgA